MNRFLDLKESILNRQSLTHDSNVNRFFLDTFTTEYTLVPPGLICLVLRTH